ncbi:hypothetical protein [Nonomuraea typhae]|uniref:Uncharacterized protein n=1 Tax=Nonomuraea typhae TaxID=2603600 RepID=A0ABW7YJB9_9ACTN
MNEPINNVRMVVDLKFVGDYWRPEELVGMSTRWIDSGLDDRDDLVDWKVSGELLPPSISQETRQEVYLISHRVRGERGETPVGVRTTPEGAREALLDVVRHFHPDAELAEVIISDATIVYDDSPVPAGELWITRNGTVAWTSAVVASAELFKLDAEIEVDV